MWSYNVIPVAVEWGGFELDAGQFRVWDFDAGRVGCGVEFRLDRQSGTRGGIADEVDDHLQAEQRSATPVLGDVAEQAVLDHVPLAGTWRQVAHLDAQTGLIRQSLEFGLPQAVVAAIAATT